MYHTITYTRTIQGNIHTLSPLAQQYSYKLPTIDDQQSTYSTNSSLTLSSLSESAISKTHSSIIPIQSVIYYNSLGINSIIYQNQITFTTNTQPTVVNNKNITKNSIYMTREIISFINQYCIESFDTNHKNDVKLLFSYIKESIAMSINDKHIKILNTIKGEVIILNIDLHFKDGQTMYLIAMSNDFEYKQKIPYKIITIMNDNTIYKHFIITKNRLPKSSRNMKYFINGLNISPKHIPENIIWQTNFKKLREKNSKIKDKHNNIKIVNISEYKLKYYCLKSWNNGIFLPGVFIKGKSHCIEWKKFIKIFNDKNGNEQWIGISLKYYLINKQWKINCLDYDAGRVYYQFRLVGNINNNKYNYSYNHLKKLINVKLNIL